MSKSEIITKLRNVARLLSRYGNDYLQMAEFASLKENLKNQGMSDEDISKVTTNLNHRKILIIENDREIPTDLIQSLKDILSENDRYGEDIKKDLAERTEMIVNADVMNRDRFLDKIVDPDLTDLAMKTVYAGPSRQQLMEAIRALNHVGRKYLNIHSFSHNFLIEALNSIENGNQLKAAIAVISNNNVIEYGLESSERIYFDPSLAKFTVDTPKIVEYDENKPMI